MKKILLSFIMTVLSLCLWAQDRTVSGRVTDGSDGSPLPGVNVVLKGTNNGTVTDQDGRYSLSVPASANALIFSFIGLVTQEVSLDGRQVVDVSMQSDVKQLSEVVVTALGIERKRNELPYAAQQVSSEQITQTRNGNFVNALSGKVAGLDIKANNNMGGSTNVVIRGYKSITGNNQALFVIDGVPVTNANTNSVLQRNGGTGVDYGNAAADINPDNIASINVLKGAAATALYGSRAANGVIMITTKKGRKESFDLVVNSGVTFGKIDKSTYARYQDEYGAGYNSGFYTADLGQGPGPVVQFDADASFGTKFDPNLMVYHWDALDPYSPYYRQMRPWVAAKNDPSKFYETSVTSNQNVTLTGGSSKTTFKVAYSRIDEKGVLPNSELKKDLANFSASFDVNDRITVSASGNYSRISGLGRYGTGYSGNNPNQQFRQWWQVNTDILEQKEAFFRNRQNISWNWANLQGTGRPIYSDNPYWTRYKNYANDTRDHYFGYATATYKITDWLDVMGRVAFDATFDLQEERVAVGSSGVRYSAIPTVRTASVSSLYSRFDQSYKEMNYDLILNFKKKFSETFSLTGLLGSNMRRTRLNSIRAATNGGLVVPDLYSLSNSVSPLQAPLEEYARVGVDGIFANASLGFKELIFIDLSARQDKSTTLPKDNNTYFYFSTAGGFIFSNVLKQPWLSLGKLRLNYAEVGNDPVALSLYDVYDKPAGFGSAPLFSLPNTKNNPALKAERTKSFEAGIEAEFYDGRLGFDFTWYQASSFDQAIPVNLTSATGYVSRFVNSGEVRNEGIELSAYGTPAETENFTWTIGVTFTRNRNKVIDLYSGAVTNVQLSDIINPLQGGVTTNAAIGQPYGVLKGTNFVYTNGQRTVNAAGGYVATASSAEVIGNPNPDWLSGITNTVTYKGVRLNFLIDIRRGGDIFSLDQWYGQGTGLYPETAGLNELGNPKRDPVSEGGGVLLPGVKADGTPNDVRGSNQNGNGTVLGYPLSPPRAWYVYDGSYVKLRELALTYSLPAAVMQKLRPLKGIDISLLGRNLWIIHKNMKYSDPEETLTSGNNANGYQSGAYPMVKNYGFNVKFNL
ncbi:SusC/RagA family TonB-linked outer membrane protein [Fulvivirgaceae bacterium PWU4]|uniref:SusC/RagA family TonB-linked outer membrane protein n=1 Tax=Chryseosolibacter histidini TaxID=2782349 RepID=A0AAP2DPC2_9BACT|nr:SusC/RagA family TonB-linked outer membrane protein [Chryseosolibacter histidini]MBT1698878.1 SusC/RagA family TonB-linked outer membrane protein [Chryseosolibacter histidini]